MQRVAWRQETPRGAWKRDRSQNSPFSGQHHRLFMPLHLLQYGMLISKDCVSFCCTTVMQKSNIPHGSVVLSCSMRSCIRIPTRSLLSKRMFVCSVRAAFENPYICSSCCSGRTSVCGERLSTPKPDMRCCTAVYL